jgi:hypothetical protein
MVLPGRKPCGQRYGCLVGAVGPDGSPALGGAGAYGEMKSLMARMTSAGCSV